jgi:hypothetical protein
MLRNATWEIRRIGPSLPTPIEGGVVADKFFRYLGNIWILDNSLPYRREVVKYLDLMRTTESGRILCDFINRQTPWMAIIPYKPTAGDPVNAYAQETEPTKAAPKDRFVWGVYRVTNEVTIPWPLGMGTGTGSDVVVKYHPATWKQYAANLGRLLPGAGPGEILFHEMLHGLRMLCGKLRDDKVAEFPDFDDIEEFYAILAANLYRTQRGFKIHRMNHHAFAAMDPDLDDSEVYEAVFRDEIGAWFKEQQDFCLAMARTPSNFNPFQTAAIRLKLMPKPVAPAKTATVPKKKKP